MHSNLKVTGYSLHPDGYLSVGIEFSARQYLLHYSHKDFCLYAVILANAAYHEHYVYFDMDKKNYFYINEIDYAFIKDLNYKEETLYNQKNQIDKQFTTIREVVSGFGGAQIECSVKFKNIEKRYFYKPEYPHYLNWVYKIACSFKEQSLLDVTYIKDTYEIINIEKPVSS